jgi:hypothetical protein
MRLRREPSTPPACEYDLMGLPPDMEVPSSPQFPEASDEVEAFLDDPELVDFFGYDCSL